MRFKVPDYYHVTKIFGPPGTGKTHTILKILKEKLDYGYSKNDVLLVGYSRATAQNLRDRCKKDLKFNDEELEPIKTLHAMCKHALPKPEPTLFSKRDKENFYRAINLPKSEWWPKDAYKKIEDDMDDDDDDDYSILKKKLNLINKGRSYYKYGNTWESIRYYFDEKQDDYSFGNIERRDLEFTYDTYRDFKNAYNIMDFTDMLTLALNPEVTFPKYKVVFIDECQDLNPLMWAVINKIIKKQGDIYLAGDDDQSIFGFNCGTPELFLEYESHGDDVVLDRSYRLPKKILDFSQRIINNISPKFRKEKKFGPKIQDGVEVEGSINELGTDLYEIVDKIKKNSWIMCARTTNKTFDYKKLLMENQILWKTKAKNGSTDPYNYSIKQKVRDILNIWYKLKNNEKLDGRQVCKLIQEIKAIYLNIKKKEHKAEKSTLFLTDNYYDHKDLINRKVFKDNFNIEEEWFNYLRFGKDDVQNHTYTLNGQDIDLFLDSDEAHDYIVEVYKKDKTLINTEILVGTIHSVKGLEAENVIICDVWSSLCYKNFREKAPGHRREEIRCAYVAVTRSSENLYMYRPHPRVKIGERSFEMLEI